MRVAWIACGLICLLGGGLDALAQESDVEVAQQEEIEELKRQLSLVVDEMGRLRTELAVPEEVDPTMSAYGLGPSASKVYGVPGGISFGGYASRKAKELDESAGIGMVIRIVLTE